MGAIIFLEFAKADVLFSGSVVDPNFRQIPEVSCAAVGIPVLNLPVMGWIELSSHVGLMTQSGLIADFRQGQEIWQQS